MSSGTQSNWPQLSSNPHTGSMRVCGQVRGKVIKPGDSPQKGLIQRQGRQDEGQLQKMEQNIKEATKSDASSFAFLSLVWGEALVPTAKVSDHVASLTKGWLSGTTQFPSCDKGFLVFAC